MTEIKSKRHILKFYFRVGGTFTFFFGFATLLIRLFVTDISTKETPTIEFLLPVFSCVLYYMSYETIIGYAKGAPTIHINNNSIKFGHKDVYSLSDVVRIAYTGQHPFKFVFNTTLEGCAIEFRDGTIRYFYDEMYSNFWILKQFLQQTLNKSEFKIITIQKINSAELIDEKIEYFKDNQFKAMTGFVFWVVLLFFYCFYFLLVNQTQLKKC